MRVRKANRRFVLRGFQALVFGVGVTLCLPAIAATYYVDQAHPLANDSNPGTALLPWKTLGKAQGTVVAFDTVIVRPGVYPERVLLQSGESNTQWHAQPIRSVTMEGFHVKGGDNALIHGFRITNTSRAFDFAGVWIEADGVQVVDNYFFNLQNKGIEGSRFGNSRNCVIDRNTIFRCEQGIVVRGTNWLIVNNEIERPVDYGVDDADYTRFFGSGHVFRRNYFHGARADEILSSHTDGFQTFFGPTTDIVIEQNIVQGFVQGVQMETNNGDFTNLRNITIRNNVFVGGLTPGSRHGGWGVNAEGGKGTLTGGVRNLRIYNNVFADIEFWGVGIRHDSTGIIQNNIFYNVGLPYNLQNNSSANVGRDYNMLYLFDAFATQGGPNDMVGIQPRFIDPLTVVGADGAPFTGDDGFNLQTDSPALDRATSVAGLNNDILNGARPQGGGYDIGANEVVVILDSDGDGFLDFIEIAYGSDPNDASSFPDAPLRVWSLLWAGIMLATIGGYSLARTDRVRENLS